MPRPMKSEHRHELESNSLAGFLHNLPQHLRTHSNKILLVLAGVLLVFAGMRYRENQKIEQDNQARQALANAWETVRIVRDELPLEFLGRPGSAASLAQRREDLIEQGNQNAQRVLSDSDKSTDAARMASAWLARGELYWALAHLPELPGAATQPSLAPKTSAAEALDIAANAYQTILREFGDQVQPVIAARLGLAAIAETKRDFAGARQQYQSLIDSEQTSRNDKQLAQARLNKLADLEKPLLLLPATQPATQPGFTDTRPNAPGLPPLPPLESTLDIPLPATQPATETAPAASTAPTTQPG